MVMNGDVVFSTWGEYKKYFSKADQRTVEKILVRLGYKIPLRGAPIIRKESLDKKCS